jgi:hypothetical protein
MAHAVAFPGVHGTVAIQPCREKTRAARRPGAGIVGGLHFDRGGDIGGDGYRLARVEVDQHADAARPIVTSPAASARTQIAPRPSLPPWRSR